MHIFLIKIEPNLSEQEKKQQRIYDLPKVETKPMFFIDHLQRKEKLFTVKEFVRKMGSGEFNKKRKKAF